MGKTQTQFSLSSIILVHSQTNLMSAISRLHASGKLSTVKRMLWKNDIGSFPLSPVWAASCCIYIPKNLSDSCFRYMLQVLWVFASTTPYSDNPVLLSSHQQIHMNRVSIDQLLAPEAPMACVDGRFLPGRLWSTEASQAENAHSLTTESVGSSLARRHCAHESQNQECQDPMTLALQFEVNWYLWNSTIQAKHFMEIMQFSSSRAATVTIHWADCLFMQSEAGFAYHPRNKRPYLKDLQSIHRFTHASLSASAPPRFRAQRPPKWSGLLGWTQVYIIILKRRCTWV